MLSLTPLLHGALDVDSGMSYVFGMPVMLQRFCGKYPPDRGFRHRYTLLAIRWAYTGR